MFDAAECMFLYLESSLRVGSGEPGYEIDLPIQREAATGYPLVPGSSLKGVLRAALARNWRPPSCLPCSARNRKATNCNPVASSSPIPCLSCSRHGP